MHKVFIMLFHLSFLVWTENRPKHQQHQNQLLTIATSTITASSARTFWGESRLDEGFILYPSIFPFHFGLGSMCYPNLWKPARWISKSDRWTSKKEKHGTRWNRCWSRLRVSENMSAISPFPQEPGTFTRMCGSHTDIFSVPPCSIPSLLSLWLSLPEQRKGFNFFFTLAE